MHRCTIQTRSFSEHPHSVDRGQGCLERTSAVLTQQDGVNTVFTNLELEGKKGLLLAPAPKLGVG